VIPFDPRHNLMCLSLQLAAESLPWLDTQWAVRGELDDDGTCRLLPLYVRDLPAFVEARWDAVPEPYLWSTAP